MSIGEVLSDARCRSGLSIGEVSRQTRIREGVIWAIELDDFSSCGGDFYARGHIRAIASVVGVDSRPLIAEYDAVHSAREADDAPGLLALSPPGTISRQARLRWRHRRRVALVTALCLAVLTIFGGEAYHFAHDTGQHTNHAAQAAFNRASARQHTQHAKPAASPSRASPSPSPAQTTAPSPGTLKPVAATAYGPWGATGDDPDSASLAIDGSPTTAWQSQWYTSPDFGHLKAGTGLLLDLGHPVTITSAEIAIGSPGAYVQLRGGNTTSATSLGIIGGTRNAGSTTVIRPQQIPIRYLLIWFTSLPRASSGAYQASVYNVTLQGQP